ncbi:MAG: Nudix family hydrolase [Zoogloeaceae bacterium]|jgi:8-oxo-dGTP diphosphatase|nr:Nudix family hydrolase [Zoogloeaceae bacterium]
MNACPYPSLLPVEVAAAVLLREDPDRFLLARRPEGKVYAGYWEFPGGKIEAGETPLDALARELQEELGIRLETAHPWLCRDFVYPHAQVRLHFWRVTKWRGEIGGDAPIEHSAIHWQTMDAPCKRAPLLPANLPILKALSLPVRMTITQAETRGVPAELARLEEAQWQGLRLIQVRDRNLSPARRQEFLRAVLTMARAHGSLVLVNEQGDGASAEFARLSGAHGLHLTARALARTTTRPDFPWVGASCHNTAELARSARLQLDYALLGPVLPTPSHPAALTLGWRRFAQWIAQTPIPVFALGGQSAQTLDIAQTHGAHGIAGIRGG